MGSSLAWLTARAALPQHQLPQTPYILSSSQEWDFFFNYLDDPHPNWVYFGDETDLDETQHLVFVSSLSQSFTHGWKVDWWQVLSALDLFLLQMLGGISPVITDLGYDHRNAGITRTRPDQMPVCSSFPPPNASETAGNFTGITHAAMHLQGKLVCASLHHL